MTLKELSQVYYLKREIAQEKKRLTGMKAQGASHADSNVAEFALQVKIAQLTYEKNRLEHYIDGIEDSYIRQIFRLRFLDGHKWPRVAVEMRSTEDAVKKACYRHIKKGKKEKRCPECPDLMVYNNNCE